MISLQQALGWLNQLDKSHLSKKSQFLLWQINDAKITESEKEKTIEALIFSARNSVNPQEYAEVLVNCARIQAERNRLPEAHIYLQSARKIYEQQKDPIRQAVVLWMMSIIEWKQLDNHTGHAHARAARGLLEEIARENQLEKKDSHAWWIQERISDMEEDLSSTPEEAYFWLNKFEGSHLKTSAIQLMDTINEALRDKQFNRVYQLISALIDITRASSDPMETNEAMVYCGLVNAQMGNTKEAVRLLRHAIAKIQPESHHHTAARWMLSMIQFNQPFEITQAIASSNQCIVSMEQLKSRAEHRNRPVEQQWYEQHAALMRKILNKKILAFEKTAIT